MKKPLERTAVYRFYAADDQLLYLGITSKLGLRWENHMRSQPWWGDAVRQTVEWHRSRERAITAEREAIRNERPRYNVMHSVGLGALVLKTPWTCEACGWSTTDPAAQIEHMERKMGRLARGLPDEEAERLTRVTRRASNAIDRAEAFLARSEAVFDRTVDKSRHAARGSAAHSISSAEAEKLVSDLSAILGDQRIRLSELPILLRQQDPEWLLYKKLRGTGLAAMLRKLDIRVTNTGNVPRLDPADLPGRAA